MILDTKKQYLVNEKFLSSASEESKYEYKIPWKQ